MSKGEETRAAILADALSQASVLGLDGLTIGGLATSLGMSKSGLYAHFGSKEDLQIQVLEEARARFVSEVMTPALRAPRGEPRVRAILDRWITWEKASYLPGGCPFVAAAAELDDQPGPVRDHLVSVQRDWMDALRTAARIAVEEGHFAPELDTRQWAFELWGLALSYHWFSRLLEQDDAEARLRAGFERLVGSARV
ncbi:MAG: TetR/AcrR family transcriptional regulator [Myxococcota bacterium]|nr:TetR/AcrR family transcriptional regulator [Myxococcota bacterium]